MDAPSSRPSGNKDLVRARDKLIHNDAPKKNITTKMWFCGGTTGRGLGKSQITFFWGQRGSKIGIWGPRKWGRKGPFSQHKFGEFRNLGRQQWNILFIYFCFPSSFFKNICNFCYMASWLSYTYILSFLYFFPMTHFKNLSAWCKIMLFTCIFYDMHFT